MWYLPLKFVPKIIRNSEIFLFWFFSFWWSDPQILVSTLHNTLSIMGDRHKNYKDSTTCIWYIIKLSLQSLYNISWTPLKIYSWLIFYIASFLHWTFSPRKVPDSTWWKWKCNLLLLALKTFSLHFSMSDGLSAILPLKYILTYLKVLILENFRGLV